MNSKCNVRKSVVLKKVQVVYYLSRNGELQQPHYIEISHIINQNLCLKDVTNKLSVLRGKDIRFMYSWSNKRNYKNGYIWKDLSEYDNIYKSEDEEYILKGTEIIEKEKFQDLQPIKTAIGKCDQEVEEESYKERISYSATPRCSIGISENLIQKKCIEKIKTPVNHSSSTPKSEDGFEQTLGRNSIYLLLMGYCGSSSRFKTKNITVNTMKKQQPSTSELRKEDDAVKVVGKNVEHEIKCMSENPRFENLQAAKEQKECVTLCNVDGISNIEIAAEIQPSLKKSSPFNEKSSINSSKAAVVEAAVVEDREEEPKRTEKTIVMKAKSKPRKHSSKKQIWK